MVLSQKQARQMGLEIKLRILKMQRRIEISNANSPLNKLLSQTLSDSLRIAKTFISDRDIENKNRIGSVPHSINALIPKHDAIIMAINHFDLPIFEVRRSAMAPHSSALCTAYDTEENKFNKLINITEEHR